MFRPHTARGPRLISYHGHQNSASWSACVSPLLSRQKSLAILPHPTVTRFHMRGKKTSATVKLSDLPQGRVQTQPLPQEEGNDGPAYPTVVLQARRNMAKFNNCVLLTRVGSFYELYFEHAEEYAPVLNLKLASKRTSAGPVPMVPQPFLG